MTIASLVVLILFAAGAAADAAPVRVRLPEGNVRGFLVLRATDGTEIAHGELRQKPAGGLIESRLVLSFKDGSVRDELAVFSQKTVFRLERYRLVHRGPTFPRMEVAFDRKRLRYDALTQDDKDAAEKRASGPLEMPADLYNGMTLVLLKNLPAGASATVQTAAFTPKPRLIKTVLSPEGEEQVSVGDQGKKVVRYVMKLELGGLTGVIAPLLGKDPPETRYWFVTGDVPAFARFEGPMFLNGPVWRLEQTLLRWPR